MTEPLSLGAFTLDSGEPGQVTQAVGQRITLTSPRPFPPGATVRARIKGVACPLEVKVRNCRKVGELFETQGSTQNATRELLAWLKNIA
ncbi:MAG: hypothetical protein MK135_16380 [Polyangiaceae bacterium]|nr:hypothetical protein [Polyangiaceae bacterium]